MVVDVTTKLLWHTDHPWVLSALQNIMASTTTAVGYAKEHLNAIPWLGRNLYCTEFHADSESGLHFDLGGCISEHKSNFHIEAPMRRFYLFGAFIIFLIF